LSSILKILSLAYSLYRLVREIQKGS
jgi:hypothetical protein